MTTVVKQLATEGIIGPEDRDSKFCRIFGNALDIYTLPSPRNMKRSNNAFL